MNISVGVLALQGAFYEHIQLLKLAASELERTSDSGRAGNVSGGTSSGKGGDKNADAPSSEDPVSWSFSEVRTAEQLRACDALVIPGGESTTMALVAERSGLLEPLREFVKVHRRPTWGTCAGLILLSESANRTKKGGQDLIGGLDVRVNRNHFGRQTESFETDLLLPFLDPSIPSSSTSIPFRAIFIRAPVVEKLLPTVSGPQEGEASRPDTVTAPARALAQPERPVEVLATLPGRRKRLAEMEVEVDPRDDEAGDIVAVRQSNVFACSFHPELTRDARIHGWWLRGVREAVLSKRRMERSG